MVVGGGKVEAGLDELIKMRFERQRQGGTPSLPRGREMESERMRKRQRGRLREAEGEREEQRERARERAREGEPRGGEGGDQILRRCLMIIAQQVEEAMHHQNTDLGS